MYIQDVFSKANISRTQRPMSYPECDLGPCVEAPWLVAKLAGAENEVAGRKSVLPKSLRNVVDIAAVEARSGLTPLVSVVVPAFNAASTLEQALHSILSQSYRNIELIVVDDGSTDETANILRTYGENLRVVHQANSGLAKARNVGCALARGEFVALMDADDLCMPERIAVQVEALQSRPEAVLCCSDFSAFDGEGPVSNSFGASYYSRIGGVSDDLATLFPHADVLRVNLTSSSSPLPAMIVDLDVRFGVIYPELAFGNFVHPPTVMFRLEVLRRVGMFDETIRFNCDWECFVRMARVGPFLHVCRPLLAYRLSATQMSYSRGNHGRGALDLVHTAEKIWRSDPSLMAANADRVRASRREFSVDAARALVEHDKLAASRMLATCIRHGRIDREFAATVIKLLLPKDVIRIMRRLRRRHNVN